MRKYLGFIVGAPLVVATDLLYGPIGVTRLFGAGFVAAGAYSCFVDELPVRLGSIEVGRLRGWKKAFVIVPAVIMGIASVIYAPGLTCLSTKYRHLCQGSA